MSVAMSWIMRLMFTGLDFGMIIFVGTHEDSSARNQWIDFRIVMIINYSLGHFSVHWCLSLIQELGSDTIPHPTLFAEKDKFYEINGDKCTLINNISPSFAKNTLFQLLLQFPSLKLNLGRFSCPILLIFFSRPKLSGVEKRNFPILSDTVLIVAVTSSE